MEDLQLDRQEIYPSVVEPVVRDESHDSKSLVPLANQADFMVFPLDTAVNVTEGTDDSQGKLVSLPT